jgi:hypothetical protein
LVAAGNRHLNFLDKGPDPRFTGVIDDTALVISANTFFG